jgi:hypothetical protein
MTDETVLTSLETDLRNFEPVFWIGPRFETLDRLYEPDGTLYAFCLSESCELSTDRRRVRVSRGDLVIIPPAVAIDVSPQASWFGIVYTGPYPYHFRERFIQVWGMEHHACSDATSHALLNDYRHRIRVWTGSGNGRPDDDAFQIRFQIPANEQSEFPDPHWYAPSVGPEESFFQAENSSYLIEIPNEAFYLLNREARHSSTAEKTISPEYKPEDHAQNPPQT